MSYCRSKFYIAEIGIFDLFGSCDDWLWPDYLHIRTWPVDPGDMPHVKIWTSYVKAFESYRLIDIHTDRQTYIQTCKYDQNYTPRRFAGGQCYFVDMAVRAGCDPTFGSITSCSCSEVICDLHSELNYLFSFFAVMLIKCVWCFLPRDDWLLCSVADTVYDYASYWLVGISTWRI